MAKLATIKKVPAASIKKIRAVKKPYKKPAASLQKPKVRLPTFHTLEEPVTVVLNCKDLEIPVGWDKASALQELCVEVPTKGLDYIYVPTTRLEMFHGIAPRMFTRDDYTNLHIDYDEDFKIHWVRNSLGGKIKRVLGLDGNVVKVVPYAD